MDADSSNVASEKGSTEIKRNKSNSGRRRPRPPRTPPPPPPEKPAQTDEDKDVSAVDAEEGKHEEEKSARDETNEGTVEEQVNVTATSEEMFSSQRPKKPPSGLLSELNRIVGNTAEPGVVSSNMAVTISATVKSNEAGAKKGDPPPERGRKPQPPAKPRTKPPTPPKRPAKTVLQNSAGNLPNNSRPDSPLSSAARSNSPRKINSRSPSPKPPIPKKPGPPPRPPAPVLPKPVKVENSGAGEKPAKVENSGTTDNSNTRKSLKRISPMSVSFTTEDLDLMHKPVEETSDANIKRQASEDTVFQRAVKKDKRRSKSVGAPAFINLLEQMQAKAVAHGGAVNGRPILRSSHLTDQTVAEDEGDGHSPSDITSPSDENLKKTIRETEKKGRDSLGNERPKSLLKQSPVVDRPGNTPPVLSKTVVVMDIDIDKSDTPKRPVNSQSTSAKTSARPKPSIPSKPKSLPPKPQLKNRQREYSPSGSSTAPDAEVIPDKSICDKRNFAKQTSDNQLKPEDLGSVEKLKVKKKKKVPTATLR